jgi:hypothetical protein
MTEKAGRVVLELDAGVALVAFEMLTREVEERAGANLANALAQEGEFWALNYVLGALERTITATFETDYAAQVRRERSLLTPAPEETHFNIVCRAGESDAMGG